MQFFRCTDSGIWTPFVIDRFTCYETSKNTVVLLYTVTDALDITKYEILQKSSSYMYKSTRGFSNWGPERELKGSWKI